MRTMVSHWATLMCIVRSHPFAAKTAKGRAPGISVYINLQTALNNLPAQWLAWAAFPCKLDRRPGNGQGLDHPIDLYLLHPRVHRIGQVDLNVPHPSHRWRIPPGVALCRLLEPHQRRGELVLRHWKRGVEFNSVFVEVDTQQFGCTVK